MKNKKIIKLQKLVQIMKLYSELWIMEYYDSKEFEDEDEK